MAFVRIKKIKEKHYAYLVENKWTKKGARQKSIGYLGKLIPIKKKKKPILFEDLLKKQNLDLSKLSTRETILSLIQLELLNHNFKKKSEILFEKDQIQFNLNDLNVNNGKRSAVLHLNEGYMCNHTINNLMNFSSEGDEDKVGLDLAKAFVSAGITVPQEVFVNIFENIYKPDGKTVIK
jgi:hypothetical protein